MAQVMITQLTNSWPSGLKSCAETAAAIGITEERLRYFADAQIAPHFRVDGGAPLFRIPEVKQWAAEHLLSQVPGRRLPVEVTVVTDLPTADARPPKLAVIENLKPIPTILLSSGIYFLCLANEVVYIGQSTSVAARLGAHQRERVKTFDSVYFVPCPPEFLLEVEAALIRALNPRFNSTNQGSLERPNDRQIIKQVLGAAL